MNKITRDTIKDCNKFNSTEKIVLDHMLMWENWNKDHNSSVETFILTNESGLIEVDAHELFSAINNLVEIGILRRRECDAVAYEWNNKEFLLDYL